MSAERCSNPERVSAARKWSPRTVVVNISVDEAESLIEQAVRDTANVSDTTAELIRQIITRDGHGRDKYGTTMDRTDLSLADWLQHQAEELMDGAGYALAAKREAERSMRVERAARAVLVEVQGFDMSLLPGLLAACAELRAALGHTSTQEPDS